MLTLISSDLCEPPSSTACFRDITLYSSCFLDAEVLLECEKENADLYWKWLREKGAWDFVEDIVEAGQEYGVSIRPQKGNISVPRIYYDNLNFIVGSLKGYHSLR